MAFSDHFVGVPQSRWTGYAILAAIIAVALAVLFGKEQISLGHRVMVIVVMFLMVLPTIFLILFQINCMVSGTSKGPYCGWYAWLVAAITILYCILLIIVAVTAKSYDEKVEKEEFIVSFEEANRIAGGLMQQVGVEGFANSKPEDTKKADAHKSPVATEKLAKVEKKKDEKKAKFTDGPEPEPEEEQFADYSYGAASVDNSASMYML